VLATLLVYIRRVAGNNAKANVLIMTPAFAFAWDFSPSSAGPLHAKHLRHPSHDLRRAEGDRDTYEITEYTQETSESTHGTVSSKWPDPRGAGGVCARCVKMTRLSNHAALIECRAGGAARHPYRGMRNRRSRTQLRQPPAVPVAGRVHLKAEIRGAVTVMRSTSILMTLLANVGRSVGSQSSRGLEGDGSPRAGMIAPFALCVIYFAVSVFAPSRAYADGTAADSAASSSLAEVTVTGYRFLDEDTSGITNLPLSIEKVPQSISIVDNDFAEAADLQNMGAVAQYTTGALWASYSPSYGNQFWLRGFAANFAIDGLTVGDQITEPDPATLQRYEIVKGPASVVYGAQSPGGIVNLVSKGAAPGTPSYLEVLGGSWGRWRIEGQAAGALNGSGTLRGIGVAAFEDGGSFVDFVKSNKAVAYGGLDFDPGNGLTGYVRAGYQRTEDTPFNGIPTFANGAIIPVPPSFFLGCSACEAIAQAAHLNADLSWQLSDLWSVDLKTLYQHTTHGGRNAYPYSTIASDGSFSPIGGEDFDDWHVEDYTFAASTLRKLDDLGLKGSSLSANVRYQRYRYSIFERGLGGATGTPDIYSGDQSISDIFNSLAPACSPISACTNTADFYQQDQRMNYLTASSQAVVQVARPLTLVGGAAYSKPMIDLQVYSGHFQSYDPGSQVNYRGAAIYEPSRGLDLYASYSESFQPNLRVDTEHEVLPPLQGKQYEFGAKYLPYEQLLLTAAVFDIRESNVPVFDQQVGIEALYRALAVRHRGLELEATGFVTARWQIRGGVALLDPTVTHDPENPVNDGETQPWLPKTTANLYVSYEVARSFTVSGGVRYSGSVKTYDSSSPAPTLATPSYVVFDTSADYSPARAWHLQLNLKNILDKHYYLNSPIFQSLASGYYPGEPRSFALCVRRDF